MPRLATLLFQQTHIGDSHAAVSSFAHIVDSEQRDLGNHTNQQLSAQRITTLSRILCV